MTRCEVCGARSVHLHHRKRRSQGGPDTADNLLAVCLDCHERIHANPADSYASGLLIRGADPITPYLGV